MIFNTNLKPNAAIYFVSCAFSKTTFMYLFKVLTAIKDYTEDYSKLAEPATDFLENLGDVAQKLNNFLKMSGPVSALVAASLDVAFDVRIYTCNCYN